LTLSVNIFMFLGRRILNWRSFSASMNVTSIAMKLRELSAFLNTKPLVHYIIRQEVNQKWRPRNIYKHSKNTGSMNKCSFRISRDGSGSGDNQMFKIRSTGRNGPMNIQSSSRNHPWLEELWMTISRWATAPQNFLSLHININQRTSKRNLFNILIFVIIQSPP